MSDFPYFLVKCFGEGGKYLNIVSFFKTLSLIKLLIQSRWHSPLCLDLLKRKLFFFATKNPFPFCWSSTLIIALFLRKYTRRNFSLWETFWSQWACIYINHIAFHFGLLSMSNKILHTSEHIGMTSLHYEWI